MKVAGLDFGWESIEVEVPDSAMVVEGPPADRIPPALEDPAAAVRAAIDDPFGTAPLADHINRLPSDARVTIGINSHLGIAVIAAPIVLDMLSEAGIDERNVQIVAAPGMHPKLRREEFALQTPRPRIPPPYPSPFHQLPPEVIQRFWPTTQDASRLFSHDCADPEHLVELGVTERGDLVEVGDCVVESDLLIYMGGFSGAPTSWGGYLGGGQSVATGFGSARSIMTHHSFPVINHPDSSPSDVHVQLMRKHKEATAAFIEEKIGKQVFYIEAALNSRMEWAAVFAGEGVAVREPQFSFADKENIVDIPHQADVVVAGAPFWSPYGTCHNPLVALSQITNAMRHHVGDRKPLREGGVAILTTPCDGTLGDDRPVDAELLQLFNRLGHNAAKLPTYEHEYHSREDLTWRYRHAHAYYQTHSFLLCYGAAWLRDLASQVIFVGARPEAASIVGARSVPTFDDAWRLATRTLGGRDPATLVLPNMGRRKHLLLRVDDRQTSH